MDALKKLLERNLGYRDSGRYSGNISAKKRQKLAAEGQSPFAVIVTCSDSRVIPEVIFSAGLGELFTVRIAGNIITPAVIGSVKYAVEDLRCPLVMVLGHTGCGAVSAALKRKAGGFLGEITREIMEAAGAEQDPDMAARANVRRGVQRLSKAVGDARVVGAIYHIEDGSVEILDLPEVIEKVII